MKNSTPTSETVKPVRTQLVPTSDIDFAAIVTVVSAKWNVSPWLTLRWLLASKFATDVASFNTILTQRLNAGSTRPQVGRALLNLETQMDDAMSYVKGYIADKYKKENAKSYYAAFGFEHHGRHYTFPTDRNRRVAALGLMIDALTTNRLEDKEYGLEFWTNIKRDYEALVNQSNTVDGQISVKVGDKNVLKKELKKALNCIIYTIKSNYPDTYKQELRDWGMQKEKY